MQTSQISHNQICIFCSRMVNLKSSKLLSYVQICSIVVLVFVSYILWLKTAQQQNVINDLQSKLLSSTTQSRHVQAATQSIPIQTNKENSSLISMYDIGMATGTDKVYHHGYERYYPLFLEKYRTNHDFKMLEIGFLLGQSYKMWLQYFPHGKVYFMDKDCGEKYSEARFCGDQGKETDLQRMLQVKKIQKALDFIIDDGSHHPVHQITSFKYLFEHGLKPGGVYIIEDIEMNYWQKGDTYGMRVSYGRDHPDSLITQLKALSDVVNREFTTVKHPFTSPLGEFIDAWTSSVFFGHNCVVITKMTINERRKFGTRMYRYTEHFNE